MKKSFIRMYVNEKKGILVLLRDYINMCVGFLLAISSMALYTDFIGKEKYIESLNKPKGWLDPKISIPLYSVIIIICLLLFLKNNSFKEKNK